MTTRRRPPIAEVFPTTYYVDGRDMPFQEETMVPLAKGDGVLWATESAIASPIGGSATTTTATSRKDSTSS